MQDRMNVPEAYTPVLPEKVKAHIEKKKAAAAKRQQTIFYQCVDNPNFWAEGGHKSQKQDGTSPVEEVLTDPNNAGALMVTYDNGLFHIVDGAMVPSTQLQLQGA